MPLDGDAKPRPKAAQLARGQRRYRRKVASPKQWQAIQAEKLGPCRVCTKPQDNGGGWGLIELHHVVSREDGGDDLADNIVPLHRHCHGAITARHKPAGELLMRSLTDAEYAYMIQRGGEDYPVRAYGLVYTRTDHRGEPRA